MNTENEYEKQATDFLAKTKTELKITFLKTGKRFDSDNECRDIYEFEFTRGTRKFKGTFGNSINDSGLKFVTLAGRIMQTEHTEVAIKNKALEIKDNRFVLAPGWSLKSPMCYIYRVTQKELKLPVFPTAYSILACLTKYDVGSFEDFCSEFGYDEDSKSAEKIYRAVCDEYTNVCKIWSDDEIETLQEIN